MYANKADETLLVPIPVAGDCAAVMLVGVVSEHMPD